MANQINNQGWSLADNYYANAMITPAVDAAVYRREPQYALISQIADLLEGGQEMQVPEREFKISSEGNRGLTEEISGRSATGNRYTLTFSDPDFYGFRVNDVVRDATTDKKAQVVSQDPGQVTIKPLDESITGSDFVAENTLVWLYDATPASGSRGKTSLYYTPDVESNYAGEFRDSQAITRDDLSYQTFQLTDGGEAWAFGAEQRMLERVNRSIENRRRESVKYYDSASRTWHSGGLDWHLFNRGGVTFPLNALPGRNDIHDMLEHLILTGASGAMEYTVLAGLGWIRQFQEEVVNDFVQWAGELNTIGGKEVQGIDGDVYYFLSKKINIIHYAALDDPKNFPAPTSINGKRKSSYSAYFIDTSPIPSTQGSLSPFRKKYFGPKRVSYWYESGSIGPQLTNPSDTQRGEFMLASNDKDQTEVHILINEGYEMPNAQKHGLMYLTT